MRCQRLSDDTIVKDIFKKIECESGGIKIMQKKSKIHYFHIKSLKTPAANILKQEILSLGGDLAVPKGVITCEQKEVEAVLLATISQLKILIKKIKLQPFGLQELSCKLKEFVSLKTYEVKIMGVLNVNEDSFFKGSRFVGDKARMRVENMIEDGAKIIDVGGVSSRPGSEGVSPQEELRRIKPIIDDIYKYNLYKKADFSLDSYEPLCIKYALDHGFKIVNDITGLANDEVAKISGEYNARVCIMHMQNDPKNMQQKPHYEDVIGEIDDFFKSQIQKAKSFGVKDIILDVGIGFGKTLQHNLTLIKHQKHFLHFGYELLVGASRKSMIDTIAGASIDARLPGTLITHIEAVKEGASIIRCHDVKEHIQALKVFEAIRRS